MPGNDGDFSFRGFIPIDEVRLERLRPPERPLLQGLIETVDHDRVVGPRASKIGPPPLVTPIGIGAGVDKHIAWPDMEQKRECIRMAVTVTRWHAQRSMIENRSEEHTSELQSQKDI